MNFKDFLLASHHKSRSEFRSYSPEEHSTFSVAFSSVPNMDGGIIRNFIFTQKTDNNTTIFTNSNFFVSSRPTTNLYRWILCYLAKNPNLYKSVYFDEFGVSNKHTLLLEQLSTSGYSLSADLFKLQERKFSDHEINTFFHTLKKAIDGDEKSLAENVSPEFFKFLVDEFQSPPRYRIINHEYQSLLSLAHFETQYFKYMFEQIKFTQFLDDALVREVLLKSKLSLMDIKHDVNHRKKI